MSSAACMLMWLKAVLEYVQAQREHHRTRSFQEEYRELLR